jgi:hypothetical protein
LRCFYGEGSALIEVLERTLAHSPPDGLGTP